MKHLLVIDDTGSPGNFNETIFLKEDRKTLVAVFIHSEIRKDLEKILSDFIQILNKKFGITELHFTDLINKKKEFKNFSNEDVFIILEQISILFSSINLPFFVQTFHKNTLKENGIFIDSKLVIDKLDFNKNEDNALFTLMIRIVEYLKKEYPNELVEIVMDEGRRRNGEEEIFYILKNVTRDSSISYKSSKEFLLLQVADFFAYSVNRMQTTMTKKTRTDFDKTVIRHLSSTLQVQYAEGITMIEVDLENFTKEDYDYHQRKKREKDGNIENWENAQK